MAIQFPGITLDKLTPESMGVPDLAGAIAKGMQYGALPKTIPTDIALKEAETRSKNAYAGILGDQLLMKLVTSDRFKNADPATQKTLLNSAVGVALARNQALGGQQADAGGNPSLSDSIQQTQTLPGDNQQASGQNSYTYNQDGSNVKATPENVAQVAQNGNSATPQGQQVSAMQNTPAQNEAAFQGTVKGAESKAKVTEEEKAKDLFELGKEATNASLDSQKLSQDIDSYVNLYDKSKLTGPIFGKFAKYGDESAQLPQLSTEMQVRTAANLFGSKTSNFKEQLAGDMKLNPTMNKSATHGAAERIKAAAERMKGYGTFFESAQLAGIDDANKIRNLWYDYNEENPFYDPKTLKAYKNVTPDDSESQKFIYKKLEEKAKGKTGKSSRSSDSSSNKVRWKMVNGELQKV